MAGGLLFVIFLVALVILAVFVAAYVGHCFLVVVDATATGNDVVNWPDDTLVDWFFDGLQLVGWIALCVAPAGLAARALEDVWLPGRLAARFLYMAVPEAWVLLPLIIIAILTTRSPAAAFSANTLKQLLRLAPGLFIFYVLSGLLLALNLWIWQSPMLLLAPPVTGASVLIYARLLGRLAWLFGQIDAPRRRKPKAVRKSFRRAGIETTNPWDFLEGFDPKPTPPQVEDEEYPELKRRGVTGYELGQQHVPAPRDQGKSKSKADAAEEYPELKRRGVEGYDLGAETAPSPAPSREVIGEHQIQRHLAERTHHTDYVPPHPFFTGVYTFPFYYSSLKPWFVLSLGGLVIGFFMFALGAFFPSHLK